MLTSSRDRAEESVLGLRVRRWSEAGRRGAVQGVVVMVCSAWSRVVVAVRPPVGPRSAGQACGRLCRIGGSGGLGPARCPGRTSRRREPRPCGLVPESCPRSSGSCPSFSPPVSYSPWMVRGSTVHPQGCRSNRSEWPGSAAADALSACAPLGWESLAAHSSAESAMALASRTAATTASMARADSAAAVVVVDQALVARVDLAVDAVAGQLCELGPVRPPSRPSRAAPRRSARPGAGRPAW